MGKLQSDICYICQNEFKNERLMLLLRVFSPVCPNGAIKSYHPKMTYLEGPILKTHASPDRTCARFVQEKETPVQVLLHCKGQIKCKV